MLIAITMAALLILGLMNKGGLRGDYPRKKSKPKLYKDAVEIRIRCDRSFREKLDLYLQSIGVRSQQRNQWLINLIQTQIESEEND